MQGTEGEVEGSVLTYVTETEFRKQRSRSPSCNSLNSIKSLKLQPGDHTGDAFGRCSLGAVPYTVCDPVDHLAS